MSVQAVNAGGNIAEILGVIAREAQEAIATILRKGTNADVTNYVEGIVKQVKKLNSSSALFEIPSSPYTSANVPDGYQTVLGYMNNANPSLLSGMKNPRNAFAADETWLQEQANLRGIPLPRVTAPACLQAQGQSESWAYPEDLLRERLF